MTDVALWPDTEALEPASGPDIATQSRLERGAWLAFWAGIAACVAYCLLVRLWGPRGLWLDEAQSVAIAKLPLTGRHGITLYQALKQDGSPPLYYLLLHWWIAFFGEGNRTVRALSFVLNLACIPPLLMLGRRVIGRRAAWVAVLAFITSPFAASYASETRMYSILVLLALLGALALERTLRAPTWWSVAGLALASVAVALTHYWSPVFADHGRDLPADRPVAGQPAAPARVCTRARRAGRRRDSLHSRGSRHSCTRASTPAPPGVSRPPTPRSSTRSGSGPVGN